MTPKTSIVFVALFLAALNLKCHSANLVINGDFSQGNTAFTTQYGFVASGNSYQPTTYAIRTSSTSFNPGLDYLADHTTGTGLMMVVDGGRAQEVVWEQTVTVEPNTNYRFAAWFVATQTSKAARIQYRVNGSSIGSPYDVPQGSGIWSEDGASWNSGSATTAVLQIIDLQTDSSVPGNDFAIDDISFPTAKLEADLRQRQSRCMQASRLQALSVRRIVSSFRTT